jgi:hypothetical protein
MKYNSWFTRPYPKQWLLSTTNALEQGAFLLTVKLQEYFQ